MRLNDTLDAGIIRTIRLKLMLSQKDFAKRLGVSVTTENRWERGHHTPSYKKQREIRRLYRLIESFPSRFL
ncbi:MAG: helix-turn-helix domain-containing protein [Acholeplasmataceae bacterium]